jgi:hypothetical protein
MGSDFLQTRSGNGEGAAGIVAACQGKNDRWRSEHKTKPKTIFSWWIKPLNFILTKTERFYQV